MSFTNFRRRFGGRLFGALAIAGVTTATVVLRVRAAHATEAPTVSSAPANDAWLDLLKGKHRQLFDSPETNGGLPLVHLMNFYDVYNKAFGTKDADINGIMTFYGNTTLYGLNDAMWAKYRLGEFTKANDPKTGAPAVTNPWRVAPVALGMTLPQASIESLQKRGATFILCNTATTIFAALVAQARGSTPEAVYADFKANILPGVTLVPGMVVAIEQAQKRGVTYHRQ
jgi:hypothetical protein